MSDRPSSRKQAPDDSFSDFDDLPEPTTAGRGQANAAPASPGIQEVDDAFAGIDDEPDVTRGRARNDANLEEDIVEEQPERKGNPLLSKLITVGGAAIMVVGGGLLFNTQFGLTDMIFGGEGPSPPVAQAPPPVAPPPPGPRVPVATAQEQPQVLRLPPPTVQPPAVNLPNQGAPGVAQPTYQTPTQPAVGMNRPQNIPGAAPGAIGAPVSVGGPNVVPVTTPGMGGAPSANPPVVTMQIPQVAASQTPLLEVQVALNNAVARIQDNQRETNRDVSLALQTGLNEIARSVITRFDRFEGRLDGMRQSVDGFGDRVSLIEAKLATLAETCAMPRTAAAPPTVQPAPTAAPAARPQPAVPAQATAPRTPTPQPQAQPAATAPSAQPAQAAPPQPVAAQAGLRGWQLRGVSQSAALLQTPQGQMQRVEIGEDVPGLGVVREIRRDGDSYVLVTSRGMVRP